MESCGTLAILAFRCFLPGCRVSTSAIFTKRNTGAGEVAGFSCGNSRLHYRLEFVKVPRAERIRINTGIHRKRPGIIGQVAVRMSVEVPRALRMMRPDPHRVMAKHNSLLRYVDL